MVFIDNIDLKVSTHFIFIAIFSIFTIFLISNKLFSFTFLLHNLVE